MDNLKKSDLMAIIKQAKKNNLTCASYSSMNKRQLRAHAESLGLIQPERVMFSPLISMETSAKNMVFASTAGNKKKSSFLRRIRRAIELWDSASPSQKKELEVKIVEDYKKLMSHD